MNQKITKMLFSAILILWVTFGDTLVYHSGMEISNTVRMHIQNIYIGSIGGVACIWLIYRVAQYHLHLLLRWQTYFELLIIGLAGVPSYKLILFIDSVVNAVFLSSYYWSTIIVNLPTIILSLAILAAKLSFWLFWWHVFGKPTIHSISNRGKNLQSPVSLHR